MDNSNFSLDYNYILCENVEIAEELLNCGLLDVSKPICCTEVRQLDFYEDYMDDLCEDRHFTLLSVAIGFGSTTLVALFINHGAVPKMEHLHYSIQNGYLKVAISLLPCFGTNSALATDEIDGTPLLFCIPENQFEDEDDMQTVVDLVTAFLSAGWWNIERTGKWNTQYPLYISSTFFSGCSLADNSRNVVFIDEINLVHFACIKGSLEFVQFLVNEANADINAPTVGPTNLTPLQLCIILKKWEMANFFLCKGAMLHMSCPIVTEDYSIEVNAIQLLLRRGYQDAFGILINMCEKWSNFSDIDYQHAVVGANLEFIGLILEKLGSVKKEMLWWTSCSENYKLPVLCFIMQKHLGYWRWKRYYVSIQLLEQLVDTLTRNGYDLNCVCTSSFDGAPLHDSLLHLVLEYDHFIGDNQLLAVLMHHKNINVNILGKTFISPVEMLVSKFSSNITLSFNRGTKSKRELRTSIWKALEILILSGADATCLEIGNNFLYFGGFASTFQMLTWAGAKTNLDFFTQVIQQEDLCSLDYEHLGMGGIYQLCDKQWPWQTDCILSKLWVHQVQRELRELRVWNEIVHDNPDTNLCLKTLCRTAIRKLRLPVGIFDCLCSSLPVTLYEELKGIRYTQHSKL